jgi:hypothetical protein
MMDDPTEPTNPAPSVAVRFVGGDEQAMGTDEPTPPPSGAPGASDPASDPTADPAVDPAVATATVMADRGHGRS